MAQETDLDSTFMMPFDSDKLDKLMEEQGIDVLVATSKHNVQYLLGGYRFFFFDYMDAIGLSRYLPILVYPRGRPADAAYFANAMEPIKSETNQQWPPKIVAQSWGTLDAMGKAVEHIKSLGISAPYLGIESGFLPVDAYNMLQEQFQNANFGDAVVPLERLRAVKSASELDLLRQASDGVIDAMAAVFTGHGAGATKRDLIQSLRLEETKRGMIFEYCLATLGQSHNRAPSDQVWQPGEIASLDSGGNYKGYIGDLCRMAILGEPDAELQDLLAEVETIQQAARKPICAGARGGDVIDAGEAAKESSESRQMMHFVAHGMGLVSHEAPRLTSSGPVPYPGVDADRPLEAGMVISIETTLPHASRGFIKLEDTVLVTESGWEGLGDHHRGWNIAGG